MSNEESKKDRKETRTVSGEWPVGEYTYKAGNYLDDWVEACKEKKVVGTMCLSCGNVYVRPRYICGRCMKKIDRLVEVSDKGNIISYSITEPIEKGTDVFGMDPVEMGIVEEGERIIITCVVFDGSDSEVLNLPLLNADPEEVEVGMKVRVVWADETEGQLSDMKGVEPFEE